MALRKDPQIVAEREARDIRALAGIPMSDAQLAQAHRKAARNEHDKLLALMAQRDALPSNSSAEWDRLSREIAESIAFINRRLAKVDELEAPQAIAAE